MTSPTTALALPPPTAAYPSPSSLLYLPDAQGGLTKPNDAVRTSLARLLSDTIRQPSQYDWEKLHQYIEARLNNLYYRSKQYLSLSPLAGSLDFRTPSSDAATLAFTSRDAQAANPFLYDYILPIYAGDVLKLASVVATRSPNLKAAPYIPGRPLEAALSRVANRGLAYLRSHWDLDSFLNQVVLGLCNSGTQFSYVNWEVSPDLYGTSTIPGPPTESFSPEYPPYYSCWNCGAENSEADFLEFQGHCRQCEAELGPEDLIQSENSIPIPGPPDPAQSIQSSNGAVSIWRGDILTVDMPFHVLSSDLDDCPWLRQEYETLKWSLIRRYREVAPELASHHNEPSQPQTATARLATDIRQSQYNPSGYRSYYRNPDLWLNTELWLTPAMYEAISKDASGQLRDQLVSQFPEGCRVCYVNSKPVALYHEPLRRHWAACKPSLSEGIYGDPLFSGYRQGCEVINTQLNMIIEAIEHMPGEVIFDKELLDSEFLQQNAPTWGSWIGAKRTDGRPIRDFIERIPGSEIKEGVVQWMEWYFSKLRETVGITPALFGGGGGPEKTARQTEIERNQALQQHLLTWNNIRRFLARTAENGLHILATKSQGKLFYKTASPSHPQVEILQEFSLLVSGGFRVWAEEAFPMTPGQRSDKMQELMANPIALPLLSITRDPTIQIVPQNLPLLHETLAIEGMEMPDRDKYDYLMEQIQQLLLQPPLPPQMGIDPISGMPMPMGPAQPSIPPDQLLFDDPNWVIGIVRGWLWKELSQTGSGLEQSNPDGLANVRAYLEAWMGILQEQMMEQQMAMAPPAEGEGAGAGPGGDAGGPPPSGEAPPLDGPPPIPNLPPPQPPVM